MVAAWLIAQRGVNTLVLVHRRQLLEQWVERLVDVSRSAAQGDRPHRRRPQESRPARWTWPSFKAWCARASSSDLVAEYGHLIVDECHHLSAQSFEQVVRRAKAKFVTGLSATVTRKDGHHPIIFMQCGPVRHRVDAKAQAAARPFEHTVLVRPTSFRPLGARPIRTCESSSKTFIDELIADEAAQSADLRRSRRRPSAKAARRWC